MGSFFFKHAVYPVALVCNSFNFSRYLPTVFITTRPKYINLTCSTE